MANCWCAYERVIWCLFSELRINEGNKHQNNTRWGTWTARHESTYIISFLARHNESINNDKNDDLHTSTPCLTRLVNILLMTSHGILMASQWPENCDAIAWVVSILFTAIFTTSRVRKTHICALNIRFVFFIKHLIVLKNPESKVHR